MSQITGKKLKVGDIVRHAKISPRPDGKDRETSDMEGVIVNVYPKTKKVEVLWMSGSVASHDDVMIIKTNAWAGGLL